MIRFNSIQILNFEDIFVNCKILKVIIILISVHFKDFGDSSM